MKKTEEGRRSPKLWRGDSGVPTQGTTSERQTHICSKRENTSLSRRRGQENSTTGGKVSFAHVSTITRRNVKGCNNFVSFILCSLKRLKKERRKESEKSRGCRGYHVSIKLKAKEKIKTSKFLQSSLSWLLAEYNSLYTE